jgi:hypothetical protein
MQPSLAITGHVVLDPAPNQPAPTALRVVARAVDLPPIGLGGPASVSPDGTFVLNIRDAPVVIGVATTSPGWALQSVRLNGEDVTGLPFDPERAIGGGLEITVTDRLGSIAGRVIDAPGVVPDALIGVVPADRSKWTWTHDLPSPVRADLQGRFEIKGLCPGPYLAFTFHGLLGPLDQAQIESLVPFATPIVVSEGQQTTVALQVRR